LDLFLAITTNYGKIDDKCSESILKNTIALVNAGHKVTTYFASDLYIDRARNLCVDIFLSSSCSDLIFIDSDEGFDDDALLKLIQYDKPIVAGAYPYKKDFLEFPVILDFSHENNCKEEETGLVYAKSAPTGFMRIQRSVFEKLQDQYMIAQDERGVVPFFATGVRPEFEWDLNWYGEDSYFCKRWRDMGGEILVEPRINFTHIGKKEFKGNYHEYLMGRSIDKIDATETGLPGWTTNNELAVLRSLASRSKSVVEVGSWKGRSTKILLEACKGTVFAVDHWLGSKGSVITTAADGAFNAFMENVGTYDNLVVLKGESSTVAKNFEGGKVDMVFIDAGHEYEEIMADIKAWNPLCKKIICGHDYTPQFHGVIQAVNENFKNINLVDSLWWVEA
jgi:hypothetical protein